MPINDEGFSCHKISRPKPNIKIDEEITESLGRDYRTLPIFEKSLFEHTYTKHYSLQTNEYLKCHWAAYKQHFQDRVFAPFQFVDIRDYHFYNCRNRLLPSQSIHTKTEFRHNLKPGPGVDSFGQMPIPQELLMKRDSQTAKKRKTTAKKQ